MKSKTPPLFAEKILRFMVSFSEKEGLSGDFEEIYNDYLTERGKIRAWLWYWGQILAYFPGFIINSVFWDVYMFKNYLIMEVERKTHICSLT